MRVAKAPYNFVSLPERAIENIKSKTYKDNLVGHDDLSKEYVSGYIEFNIRNHTPLMIGRAGKKNNGNVLPFVNDYGNFAIPGNTLKGIVRNNVAILSMSNISKDIDDDTFCYRSFGKDKLSYDYKKRLKITTANGNKISYLENIHCGFIYKNEFNDYILKPVKIGEKREYYSISEPYLRMINPTVEGIHYMYNEEIKRIITERENFKGKANEAAKRNLLKTNKNRNYTPYHVAVSFEVDGKNNIRKIGNKGEYNRNGVMLSSENMPNKMAHYIIPTDCYGEEEISFTGDKKRYIDYYNNDLLRTKKYTINKETGKMVPNNNNGFFGLPEKQGERNGRAIFYGKYNGSIYLGYTPYLRIPYEHSLKYGISENYKNVVGISYVDSLFGFTNKSSDKLNYKGKVSFEDCISNKKYSDNSKRYKVILSQPRATAYPLYLKQDLKMDLKKNKNYNDDGFRIRGIKQYWIRDKLILPHIDFRNRNIESVLYPVPENNVFKGKIHYRNLTKDELGLLIWSLKVSPKAHENIGMGKPYGFGNVTIEDIKVYKEDLNKKFSSMSKDYFESVENNNMVSYYKNYIKERLNGKNIDDEKSIKELVAIKENIIYEKQNENYNYMTTKEYSYRNPLPSIEECIRKKDY